MLGTNSTSAVNGRAAFLCVDDFLSSLPDARALQSAFELGLIDRLCDQPASTWDDLQKLSGVDAQGLRLLIGLLRASGVVEEQGVGIALTGKFRSALQFRDLLQAKLDFASLVAPDFLELFTALLKEPRQFQSRSRLFQLFGYQHSIDPTPENYARTQAWMRYTTCLTRYEAQTILREYDFSRHRRMLDIGGNSGEFVLQVCKAIPTIQGTVFDLPVVCAIGQDHVRSEPEAARIDFVAGNGLTDPLPAGCDLITFKSMLHDWPELEAKRLLTRASQALGPGGTLLIFERAPIEIGATGLPYSMIPMLLFFRSFRPPGFYKDHLEAIGMADVKIQTIHVEMPFFLVTARLGH